MKDFWSYHNPVRIMAGVGVLRMLRECLSPGLWLVVTTHGTVARGTVDRLQSEAGPEVRLLVCDGIQPNPDIDFLDALAEQYRGQPWAGIVGLGGGSALDAAKILAVLINDKRSNLLARRFREGEPVDWCNGLPVVAIPTTAGTGAEVTPFATVWDRQYYRKYSVSGPEVLPLLALIDPELTISLPISETLYTGLDATSHAFESLWNKNRTPISEAMAWQAIELLGDAFPTVLSEGGDVSAREKMMQAALLAGLAISQTRTAIAHSVSYPLTARYGIPHGLACGFTLPYLIRSNADLFGYGRHRQIDKVLRVLEALDLRGRLASHATIDWEAIRHEVVASDRAANYQGHPSIDEILRSVAAGAS